MKQRSRGPGSTRPARVSPPSPVRARGRSAGTEWGTRDLPTPRRPRVWLQRVSDFTSTATRPRGPGARSRSPCFHTGLPSCHYCASRCLGSSFGRGRPPPSRRATLEATSLTASVSASGRGRGTCRGQGDGRHEQSPEVFVPARG